MTTYYARKEYIYDNGDTIFSIPFSYIKPEHIVVLINGEDTKNYTYLNTTQIRVTETLNKGDKITIARTTPIDSRMVIFSDTSILDKDVLNLAQTQTFDAVQEIYDNNEVFKIETNDNLAVNKQELENIIENNKQEILGIQSSFENEVNIKIEKVSSAAEKINKLEESVNTAVTAANTASEKADNAANEAAKAKTEVNNAKAEVIKATEQANIATSKANEATEIVENSLANIESKTQEEINKIKQTGFYMQGDKLYYIDSNGETKEFKSGGSGLEICDIGMALYVDETKGLRRYLNGQIVDINSNTQAFLNRLKEITTLHPSLLCAEEEWQTAKTMSAFGQVGKFVFNYSGDEIISVRLPRVVNVQGLFDLQNLGMTVGAGLPNMSLYTQASSNKYGSQPNVIYNINSTGGTSNNIITTDASGTNKLYIKDDNNIIGNSDTIQPEAIQYPYFIQIATGSETENNIINEIELNNPYSLFDSKYSDHELNNLSWLKSEGQWNAKAVYPTAYDKLLKVYNGTETVEGLSVKLSTETYTDYDFVLNTVDETFRLPLKTKLASGKAVVGNGMTLGFTDGTNNYGVIPTSNNPNNYLFQGGYYGQPVGSSTSSGSGIATEEKIIGITTDPTKSGIELSDSGLYLYFYVGETVQNANLIDTGRIGEQLADKIGHTECKAYITETYVNGTSGYRLYSDKWCEQWGYKPKDSGTVTLLKEYKDTNYGVLAYVNIKTTNEAYNFCWSGTKTVSAFTIGSNAGTLNDAWIISAAGTIYWKAEGYIV